MNVDTLRQLLEDKNVRAMLRVIREAESSQDDAIAYRLLWGGSQFTGGDWQHPNRIIERPDRHGNPIRSSAAGAYQFLSSTWRDVASLYGLPDFSPPNQDLGAVALMHRAGALDDVEAGRFEDAVRKLSPVWAGLPGDVYGQGAISMARARAAFERWGGVYEGEVAARIVHNAPPAPGGTDISADPSQAASGPPDKPPIYAGGEQSPPTDPAPIAPPPAQERPAMPASILASVASAVVPELLRILPWHKVDDKVNVQAIQQAVIDAARQAAGQQGVAESAQAVIDQPAARERFVQAMAVKWADIQPAMQFEEQSRKEARQFADTMTSTGPGWRQIGYGLIIGLMAVVIVLGGGWMFFAFMTDKEAAISSEQKAMILGALLAAFGSVIQYFFGSSVGSKQSGDALRQIAGRQ